MSRVLYHFPNSPFSRRSRLALAHKGLTADLRDARNNPELLEEARKLSTQLTIPVLVDGDTVVGDSLAIIHYLDVAYPDAPRLWPTTREDAALAFDTTAAVDGALNVIVDLGSRYFALESHAAWEAVKSEMVERAQRNLDKLAARVEELSRSTIAKSGWSAADISLLTCVLWLEALPGRAGTFAPVDRILKLGWRVPEGLARWADAHRERKDVRSL